MYNGWLTGLLLFCDENLLSEKKENAHEILEMVGNSFLALKEFLLTLKNAKMGYNCQIRNYFHIDLMEVF